MENIAHLKTNVTAKVQKHGFLPLSWARLTAELYSENPRKPRCIRHLGINPAGSGSQNHGTGLDGIWEISNFTGLHGTLHGFHGIYPNFTELVYTGSGFFLKSTGRDRDREHFHGISLDGNGIFKFPRDHGIVPTPAGCHNGKNPEEIPENNEVGWHLFVFHRREQEAL